MKCRSQAQLISIFRVELLQSTEVTRHLFVNNILISSLDHFDSSDFLLGSSKGTTFFLKLILHLLIIKYIDVCTQIAHESDEHIFDRILRY